MGIHGRLFLAVGLAGLAVGCRLTGPDASSRFDRNGKARPELSMDNLKVQSYSPKGLEWEMVSPGGEAYTEKNVMQIKDIRIQLFENSQKSSQIQADLGYMATGPVKPDSFSTLQLPVPLQQFEEGDILFSGNVVVVSTDGQKLATEWLHYKKKIELVVSSAPVSVEREDSTTHGTGLEATADLSQLKIFNQNLRIRDIKRKS